MEPRPLKILLTGGGSGGHITPLLAVAEELKRQRPDCYITYIGEKSGKFGHLVDGHHNIDQVHTIYAGKFRRYHGESWLTRLLDVKTNLLNLRDMFYFLAGSIQSWLLLGKLKPDVIFLKGGFVGVPVGLAASLRKIPFATHDSDSLPGLANRIVSRWARLHATAMEPQTYPYPKSKTKQVGVLVSPDYKHLSPSDVTAAKRKLKIAPNHQLLLITGGSLGATRLNKTIAELMPAWLNDYPNLSVIHQVGKGKLGDYAGYKHDRLSVTEFMKPMPVYTAAADVVITRAGANTLAELGVQGKACIVIPNPELTGGHQTKNGRYLEKHSAAKVVSENDLQALDSKTRLLLRDSKQRQKLADKLRSITIDNAAHLLAKELVALTEDK